jgi:hypothetical protein
VLRFTADVERLGRFHLHAIGQLERLNSRFELRLGLALGQVSGIELAEQIELAPLFVEREILVANVLDQFFQLGVLRIDVRPLEYAGQKTSLPDTWL